MDIEKMREQFEQAATGHYLLCERSLQRDEHQLDEYLDPEVQVAWEFWQASREAVVVELPLMTNNGYDGFYPEVGVKRAIQVAGLKVKP